MKQVAIYGKGGIGKSTISSHLSAALAVQGKRVVQVGCDPKHDSTRLLTGGDKIITVLDYLKITPPDQCDLKDIMVWGFAGVGCIEAGGPEPGVGCAGRGILTTFELLERLGLRQLGFDLAVYDVLGDVVCGGFAVPLRHEYADQVYIVTSGEFMSLYAANNILRGLKNYDGDGKRAAGLIPNLRGGEEEMDRIKRFSWAVQLPLCGIFPRSNEFAWAEQQGCTLVEGYPASDLTWQFFSLARQVAENVSLFPACPLSDGQLEEIVLGREKRVHGLPLKEPAQEKALCAEEILPVQSNSGLPKFFSKNVLLREPLHGCAFNGAVNILIQIRDGVTVAHGPKSCAHISYQTITSVGRRALFEKGMVLPVQISPPLISSDMDEGVMVFGGLEELKTKIAELRQDKPAAIFVVTTCPAGIIGEDVDRLADPGGEGKSPVIPLKADGNITGDYLQGVIMAYVQTAKSLVNRDLTPEEDLVNIIGEKTIARNTEKNFTVVRGMLDSLGLAVNCRFLCRTSREEVGRLLRGKINLLSHGDFMGRTLKRFLETEFKMKFLDRPFPVGFRETEEWLGELAGFFHKEEKVEAIVQKHRAIYRARLADLKPILEHKRLLVITFNHDIDWILEPILDLGMEIVKIGILNYSQDFLFRTRFAGTLPVEESYSERKRKRDLKILEPDLVLSNYTSSEMESACFSDTIPLCPDVGFLSGLELAERWAGLFKLKLSEGWKKDGRWFKKYQS
ncbi:nitrogen fixation protein NifEH [Candidatus Formimonas warabiya]|uniref:nitrogenase n=2 Tax=Formimonas warabiya TaxID=1761012 RepID=A0A3G1L2K2_FORW1|nr:nitrogen fixation protein NifEH [Candidatus Formimonas warabiya]